MENNKPYPTKKVIFSYGLIAPIIGSLLAFSGSFAIAMIANQNINDYGFSLLTVFFIIATVISAMPAFITGIWIAKNKTYIKKNKDYFNLFIKGFVSCCLFLTLLVILLTINDIKDGLPFEQLPNRVYVNFLKEYPTMLIFMVIGGLSAMICGKLFLPKLTK